MYKKYIFSFTLLLLIFINLHYSTKYDNDVIILENFYSIEKFNEISNYIKKTKGAITYDKRVPERKTYMYKNNNNIKFSELTNMLHTNELKYLLENSLDKKYKTNNFPIEYRIYDSKSKGMLWHVDKEIFDGIYYECVLTLSNNSQSLFEYIDMYGKLQKIKTKPNTLVCVTPSSIKHRVTPSISGDREILKFVITFNDNSINKNYYNEIKEYDNGL